MKVMFAAFAALAVISVGSWYVLNEAGFSSDDRQSSSAVRLN
jgi:hypothetical protein